MARYATGRQKRVAWDIDCDEPCRINPIVDDHEAIETGLITISGEPIMRLPNPIGFGRDEEWG